MDEVHHAIQLSYMSKNHLASEWWVHYGNIACIYNFPTGSIYIGFICLLLCVTVMVVIVSFIKGNETRCTEFQMQLKSITRANAWLVPTNNQLLMQQILWGVLSTFNLYVT